MNKLARKRRPPSPAVFDTPSAAGSADPHVVDQARALDSIFIDFARQVLIDDDPAAELPLRQLRVCMALYDEPRSMSQLSRELRFSLSAMTQIADRLERAGLVTRWFAGPDRRVRRLRLTPRARRMLRLRQEARICRVAGVLARMQAEARQDALRALEVLRHAAASEGMNGHPPTDALSDIE
jgi:DNA-binding MarR family transcriptional regulator